MQFAVGQPDAAGAAQAAPAASSQQVDQLNAQLAEVAARRAAIVANENRPGTVLFAGGLKKGTVGLTTLERLNLLALDAQDQGLRDQLEALKSQQQSHTVGNQGQLPAVVMLPMWTADP